MQTIPTHSADNSMPPVLVVADIRLPSRLTTIPWIAPYLRITVGKTCEFLLGDLHFAGAKTSRI